MNLNPSRDTDSNAGHSKTDTPESGSNYHDGTVSESDHDHHGRLESSPPPQQGHTGGHTNIPPYHVNSLIQIPVNSANHGGGAPPHQLPHLTHGGGAPQPTSRLRRLREDCIRKIRDVCHIQ